MTSKAHRARTRRKARAALFATQSGKCHYCTLWIPFDKGTVDHMHPTSKGGADVISNMVYCCRRCNAEKADSLYDDYLTKIAKRRESKGFSVTDPKTITDVELASLCDLVDKSKAHRGVGLTFNEVLLARLINRIHADARTIRDQTAQIAHFEQVRPRWAMGYTTDSQAAQATTAALTDLHQMLNTNNHSEAVSRLQELIEIVRSK